MRKAYLPLVLLVMSLFLLAASGTASASHQAAFVVGQSRYSADGQVETMDVVPFVENGRQYVPLIYLARSLGVEEENIQWSPSARTITIVKNQTTLVMAVGGSIFYVNDQPRDIEAPPLLRQGRVFLPARYLAEALGYQVGWDGSQGAILIGPPGRLPEVPEDLVATASLSSEDGLPVVGTLENLQKIVRDNQSQWQGYGRNEAMKVMEDGSSLRAASQASDTAQNQAEAPSASSYSGTNIQVAGVDEADLVKTDGQYIYQVNNQRVIIARAYPADQMKIVKTLSFNDREFYPRELYVDQRYLVVIGSSYHHGSYPLDQGPGPETTIYPPPYIPDYTVKAIIYDIANKSNIQRLREVEIDGDYNSSRKIGSVLYLVANKGLPYQIMEDQTRGVTPSFRDTASGEYFQEVRLASIRYFPGCPEPNYLVIAGLDLANPQQQAKVYTYLGSSQNIYASTDNLYVAVTGFSPQPEPKTKSGLISPSDQEITATTKVYRFALSQGQVSYQARGEVPGTILNQFSMDEYDQHFRIATTKDQSWSTDRPSSNNLYVLDKSLNIVGRIEDIAPGERIYSTRFMGKRGYMVTFRQVDPLFVIDLANPREPKILGKLKIPGYSDYLHPYDENHIIGFGKDTIELSPKNLDTGQAESMAFYTGMKVAVFDVTDVTHPVEMFVEKIGDRGTDSELLRNHKALLFSQEKNLLAFPVTIMEVKNQVDPQTSFPEYGQFTFQGACVYHLDLNTGFRLKGKISHLSSEDYLKAGDYGYNSDRSVERILYIGDTLYTLSPEFIQAHRLSDLQPLNSLNLQGN